MEQIKITGLYNAAYRAYSGISFSPEKRAEQTVIEHEAQLNEDVSTMPESEVERYVSGYNQRLFALMSAKSRCLSVMITGPANFPNRRNEKANQSEHNRSIEFSEWREKALKFIAKKIEESKPQDQKDDEQFADLKHQVDNLFKGWLVDRFRSRLETVAKTGNVELIKKTLDYFAAQQIEKKTILATPRHGIWKVSELAEKFQASIESVKADSTETEINGVKVVRNFEADRIQLFFDGKPEPEMISKLKHNGFRWSPSNGCWQRQLTQNAIWATNHILK